MGQMLVSVIVGDGDDGGGGGGGGAVALLSSVFCPNRRFSMSKNPRAVILTLAIGGTKTERYVEYFSQPPKTGTYVEQFGVM